MPNWSDPCSGKHCALCLWAAPAVVAEAPLQAAAQPAQLAAAPFKLLGSCCSDALERQQQLQVSQDPPLYTCRDVQHMHAFAFKLQVARRSDAPPPGSTPNHLFVPACLLF